VDSKLALEEDISHLQKKKYEVEAILGQKKIALKHALASVEEARERFKLHERNRYFARFKADMVNIDEYRETLKNLKDAKDEHAGGVENVLRLEGSVLFYSSELDKIQQRLIENRYVHADYGKLIQFPIK
jgi:chromosomal replication initiation ATPase DnaA